jgi:hypothetical protein
VDFRSNELWGFAIYVDFHLWGLWGFSIYVDLYWLLQLILSHPAALSSPSSPYSSLPIRVDLPSLSRPFAWWILVDGFRWSDRNLCILLVILQLCVLVVSRYRFVSVPSIFPGVTSAGHAPGIYLGGNWTACPVRASVVITKSLLPLSLRLGRCRHLPPWRLYGHTWTGSRCPCTPTSWFSSFFLHQFRS